ncbi:MAG: LamG-like jellyroll fold domain-containing protein [Alcanivorax sp.]
MMVDSIPLTNAIAQNILSIQRTQRLIDRTTERLASGLKVISALDDPQNFFNALSLSTRASDLERLLDGIAGSVQTLNEAQSGVEGVKDLLGLAESVALSELEKLRAADSPTEPAPTVPALSTQILNAAPDAYWELNETGGGTVANQGSLGGVDGTLVNSPTLGGEALHSGGSASVEFDGVNQYITIPDSGGINLSPQSERTIELVFNADTTAGRQVLYEEGATVNSLTIYIDNGNVYVTGRDQGAWGPALISAPINAGETYHVAFTLNSNDGEFIGYLNGQEIGRDVVTATFPSHSGDIGIGAMNESAWFHDGSASGTGFYFDGRISDVAVYNDTLSAAELANHATAVTGDEPASSENDDFNKILDQITQLVEDSHYRGVNLLQNDDLITTFNEDGSNINTVEGVDFTAEGLGIEREGFDTVAGIERILDTISDALDRVRGFGRTLVTDITILTTREDFTQRTINTLKAGSDDLTVADLNEEGANMLALQTRQSIAVSSLSFAAQANSSVISLFT